MSKQPTRIFIVDDHPLVREGLSSLLSAQPDFQVCGAEENVAKGMAGIVASVPDVAIIDLLLKGGSGLDLIKSIRSTTPSVRIIALSMHEEVTYAERALRTGALGYVTKRESMEHIVDAIRQVNAGHTYASPEMLSALTARMVGHSNEESTDIRERLTNRELEVFRRLGRGQDTRDIATEFGLSIKTIQVYCANIKEKLGINRGTDLVREAVRWAEANEEG